MNNMNIPKKVAVIGLGFVGLTLGLHLTRCGFKVLGVEKNPATLKALNESKPTFFEPGIEQVLSSAISNGDMEIYDSEIPQADYFIITVGTPIDDDHNLITAPLISASKQIAVSLKDGDTVIVRSTVRIGITRKLIKPILDKSGAKYNIGFCPERTLEGRAMEELKSLPQIVSGIDETSLKAVTNFFKQTCNETVECSSLEAAETVKLFNNTERDIRFSISNSFARIASNLGLSYNEIKNNCNYNYARSNLASPGPVAGPCLSKDPYILADSVTKDAGSAIDFVLAARRNNEDIILNCIQYIKNWMAQNSILNVDKISILGLAFKGEPATSDLRGSLAIPLIAQIVEAFPGSEISGYDALVDKDEARKIPGLSNVGKLQDVVSGASILIVQTTSPEFIDVAAVSDGLLSDTALIFDFWGNVNRPSEFKTGLTISYFGDAN